LIELCGVVSLQVILIEIEVNRCIVGAGFGRSCCLATSIDASGTTRASRVRVAILMAKTRLAMVAGSAVAISCAALDALVVDTLHASFAIAVHGTFFALAENANARKRFAVRPNLALAIVLTVRIDRAFTADHGNHSEQNQEQSTSRRHSVSSQKIESFPKWLRLIAFLCKQIPLFAFTRLRTIK
jgi:hypothetical protein